MCRKTRLCFVNPNSWERPSLVYDCVFSPFSPRVRRLICILSYQLSPPLPIMHPFSRCAGMCGCPTGDLSQAGRVLGVYWRRSRICCTLGPALRSFLRMESGARGFFPIGFDLIPRHFPTSPHPLSADQARRPRLPQRMSWRSFLFSPRVRPRSVPLLGVLPCE